MKPCPFPLPNAGILPALVLALASLAAPAWAAPRNSAAYAILTEALDAGGKPSASAGYSQQGHLGAISSSAASAGYALAGGFVQTLSAVGGTDAPILTSPAVAAVTKSPVNLAFTLPEAALNGSVKLTFTGTVTRLLTLANSEATAGAHSFSFNPANPSAATQIASGSAIPDGTYIVTLSYQDAVGNLSASASSSNVLLDTTAPTFSLPGNLTVPATSPFGAAVNYAASASDPGGSGVASSTFTPASGSTFPIATTTVNASATDQAGNLATGSFTVTVTPLSPAQSWRYQYFATVNNTGNAADTADPDEDGLLNVLEFATHSNPTTYNLAPGELILDGADLEFTYTRSKAAMNEGLAFDVEWSDELTPLSWSTIGVSEIILGEDASVQQVKASVPAGSNGRRFVRLEVTP